MNDGDSSWPDPRWDWYEIKSWDGRHLRWVRGPCNHLNVVDVKSIVDMRIVAHLCTDCDTQLPE